MLYMGRMSKTTRVHRLRVTCEAGIRRTFTSSVLRRISISCWFDMIVYLQGLKYQPPSSLPKSKIKRNRCLSRTVAAIGSGTSASGAPVGVRPSCARNSACRTVIAHKKQSIAIVSAFTFSNAAPSCARLRRLLVSNPAIS